MNATPDAARRTWTRRLLDRAARGLARLLLAVFYRSAETQGLERIPARGPVLFVANHGNALVDPLVLVALLPRLPRFLAKHTLWRNPAVRPLLGLAGAVPVYRAQEGDTARNQETFARCHAELAQGGAIGLFPEGISHDLSELQPLRTGAARIALGARASGAEPVVIVPVGLTFENKRMFRSRLLLGVGEPIAADGEDDAEGVRTLTEVIDAGLRAVTLNTDTWQSAQLLARAAEVYGSDPARAMPGMPELGDQFSLRHAFGAGYAAAREAEPARVDALEAMVRRYELLLAAFRLRDDHVIADYPWAHVAGYVGDRALTLLAQIPFAAIGYALNALPYHVVAQIAKRVEHQGDMPATIKVLGGFFLYPIVWALEAAAAGYAWGARGALAIAAIAPITGWLALRFFERNESFWNEARAYLTLRAVPHRAAELRALRRMIREELEALVK